MSKMFICVCSVLNLHKPMLAGIINWTLRKCIWKCNRQNVDYFRHLTDWIYNLIWEMGIVSLFTIWTHFLIVWRTFGSSLTWWLAGAFTQKWAHLWSLSFEDKFFGEYRFCVPFPASFSNVSPFSKSKLCDRSANWKPCCKNVRPVIDMKLSKMAN